MSRESRRKFLPRRPSHAAVVAYLALFVALGGSASAAIIVSSNGQVAQNAISGHHPPSGDHANIIRGSVSSQDLANGAVTPASLGAVAKFRELGTTPTTATQVLSLGGLRVSYYCNAFPDVRPLLVASTSVNHASITLGFTTGDQGFGSSFFDRVDDFNTGNTLTLTESNQFGEGTAVYSTPAGTVVTLNFGFDTPLNSSCLAQGVAIER